MHRASTDDSTRCDLTLGQCVALVWKACEDVEAQVDGQTSDVDELGIRT